MLGKVLSSIFVTKCCTVNTMSQISRRYAAKKTLTQRYQDFFNPSFPKPPYNFVCQIGDPILRQPCEVVDESLINTPGFQDMIAHMWELHRTHEILGLSAPQIGLPLQVAVIGFTEAQCKERDSKYIAPVPHRVLINPRFKVLDHNIKVTESEGCASVCGYSAEVSRFAHIQVEALNEKGVKETWKASGFEARVIQHEIDHLQGIIFVDKMEAKSLECSVWQHVHLYKGQGYIPFGPGKRTFLSKIQKLLS